MYKYAVINKDSKKVTNVILWDGETKWSPPENHFVVRSDEAEIGLEYTGEKFIEKK